MYLPNCLDGVLVDLVWRLFSNHGICVVGDASPKHKEIRTNEVFGNDSLQGRKLGFKDGLLEIYSCSVSG